MTIGGPAQPVSVSAGTPDGGPALAVAVVEGQVVTGGPALAVVEVTDGRPVQGNVPIPVSVVSDGRPTIGGAAIPVVVVSGSFNPGIYALLRDRFTTAQDPLVDGAAVPGAGTRDVTGALFKALASHLRGGVQASSPTWGSSRVVYDGLARVAGRALAALIIPDDFASDFAVGWSTNPATTDPRTDGHGWVVENGNLQVIVPGFKIVLDTSGRAVRSMQYLVVVALMAQGAYVLLSTFANGDATNIQGPLTIPQYPLARLLWVNPSDTTATLYPYFSAYDAGAGTSYPNGHSVDDVRVVDVEDWSSDMFLAEVWDRFDRPDGAIGTSSSGDAWATDSGTFQVISEKGRLNTASGGYDVTWLPTTAADGFFQCDVTYAAGGVSVWGLAVRRSSANNYIRLTNFGGNQWQLGKVVAGVYTALFNAGFTFSLGQTYRISLLMQGNQYLCFINGTLLWGAWQTDSQNNYITATGIGLVQVGTTNRVTFDNISFHPHTITLPAEIADGAVPSVLVGGAVVASDTFTGTNGTRLNVHTPSAGGPWTEHVGTWTLNNNAAERVSAGTINLVTQPAVGGNIEATLAITTPAALSAGRLRCGIGVRVTDVNNFIEVRLYKDPSQPGADEVEIGEINAGVHAVTHKSVLGSFYTTNTTYTLVVQTYGDLILVFLNGTPALSYRPSQTFAGTDAGIVSFSDDAPDIRFDGWVVKAL